MIPDQAAWALHPIALQARALSASRWSGHERDIAILDLWTNEQQTGVHVLDKNTMAQATYFSFRPEYQLSPGLMSEFNRRGIVALEVPLGTLYLTEEYIPRNEAERRVVRNYYAGKYPWLGQPAYHMTVKPKSNWVDGTLQVGGSHYLLLLGLPISLVLIE